MWKIIVSHRHACWRANIRSMHEIQWICSVSLSELHCSIFLLNIDFNICRFWTAKGQVLVHQAENSDVVWICCFAAFSRCWLYTCTQFSLNGTDGFGSNSTRVALSEFDSWEFQCRPNALVCQWPDTFICFTKTSCLALNPGLTSPPPPPGWHTQ